MKTYIGIDIGQKGGITVMRDGKVKYIAMPMGEKTIDIYKILVVLSRFRNKDVHVIFERLHGLPRQKLSVIWGLGRQVGIIDTIMVALKLPYTEVTPQTWQKEMLKGIPVMFKTIKIDKKPKEVKDTKKMALSAAKKLFPKENFLATKRSTVAHDGIIDSLLLAEYARRKNL